MEPILHERPRFRQSQLVLPGGQAGGAGAPPRKRSLMSNAICCDGGLYLDAARTDIGKRSHTEVKDEPGREESLFHRSPDARTVSGDPGSRHRACLLGCAQRRETARYLSLRGLWNAGLFE